MVAKGSSEREGSDLFIRTGRIQYIVMAFILTGFILFGRDFVRLWAGNDYEEAYSIALLFFVPLTVPLIQNLGITILQARNQMKFRSLLYIIVALLSLGFSFPLAKKYGGIGCAWSTALALVLGHIVVMNIYYCKVIHIEIVRFWKEIGKMSWVPLLCGGVTAYVLTFFELNTIWRLVTAIIMFSAIYLPLFWFGSMNRYERDLLFVPIRKLLQR